jgi:hypothetical protein
LKNDIITIFNTPRSTSDPQERYYDINFVGAIADQDKKKKKATTPTI